MARGKSIERRSPLALNYVERSGFRRRALCVLTLLALAEVRSANAACVPAGTSHGIANDGTARLTVLVVVSPPPAHA